MHHRDNASIMVFMLRLISGLLIVSVYAVKAIEVTTLSSNISNETRNDEKATTEPLAIKYNTLASYNPKVLTDQDVENIVKPLKFAKDSEKNSTTLKLNKSEPYRNHINRTNSARAVDIDVDKFSAPVDHNAVYTSPDNGEYKKDSFHSTEHLSSYEYLEPLTTPKTPYFDKKFQEIVDNVDKILGTIPDSGFESSTPSKNYSSDNYIDELEENTKNAKIDYKSIERIKNNRTVAEKRNDQEKETRTTINYEKKYNVSTSYEKKELTDESNELNKEMLKHSLNDDTANEVKQNPVRHSQPITTVRYIIKETPTERGDPAIISNRIEGETTTPLSTPLVSNKLNNPRGSIKFADYNKLSSKTTTSPSPNKALEQTVEENVVVPVHVTAPNKDIASPPTTIKTESELITTIKTKSIILQNNTFEPADDKQSTTVYIFVQPEDMKDLTTIKNEIEETQKTSVASTPRAFQSVPSTIEASSDVVKTQTTENITPVFESEERTTAVTSIPRGFSLPTTTDSTSSTKELLETTTYVETTTAEYSDYPTKESTTEAAITTSSSIEEKPTSTTPEELTVITTDLPHITTTEFNVPTTVLPDTTTGIIEETTATDLRTSKNMKFLETTEVFTTQTSEPTTLKPEKSIDIVTTTTENPTVTTTIENEVTTQIKTEAVTDSVTTLPTITNEITSTISTKQTSEVVTKVIIDATPTTIPKEQTSEVVTKDKMNTTTTISKGQTSEVVTKDKINPTTTISKGQTSEVVTKDIIDTTPTISEEQTSQVVTKDIIHTTPTKTLLENETTEDKPSEETKTTPSTSFSFVHIKNIDQNHTTMTPDELKPNEMYTTPGVSSEFGDNMKPSTETPADETTSSGLDGPSSSSGTVVAIIISCVGGICLIALACLLIVMRNRQNRFNYGQRCRPVSLDDYSVDNVSVFNSVRRKNAIRGSKTSYGNPAFEDPVCLTHPLNFPAISKFANNEEDVTAEFKDIPQIVARTSELPEGCETKNRYANVIPLPESRVFLNHVEGYPNSDYINANFVTGPKNTRKYYIACQAPMSNTVDDFWRMIWEQQCKVILMLTHLFENGNEKCFDYLPPSEVLDCHRLFGDYQVTLKKREVKEKYIISSIQLKNMVSNSWREVTHFWYMGWPEKGVPAEANSIIAFLIEARSYMKNVTIDKKIIKNGDLNGVVEVNPVVVHCSPGTGRTGAVITCDIAIREFEQTRQVDIPKIVYKIRRDRAGAVQTKEQYAFIYKVIDFYATKLAGGNLESI